MPLSAAEKKRRSRARKPAAYHAAEREASRKRMAMNRARNRAQKRAREIKSILSYDDRGKFEARAHEEKTRLVRDWFHRNGMRFEPKVMRDERFLLAFMTKRELCEIDLKVAEFEISMFRVDVGREFYNASGLKKDDKKITAKSQVAEFEISTVRGGLGREFYDASGPKKDNQKITAKSHKVDPSEQNLNNQIDRLSEKEMANGNAAMEILDEEQEATTKPASPGKNGIGVLSELEQNFKNEVDRLSEKEMTNVNAAIEILDEEQEDKTKPAHSGRNDIGVSSDREEDCISWEDEIAAAKAMAIMQLMRREPKPAKDVVAPGARATLQGAPQARTVKEKGKILAKNASANAKIKARILHKVALAAGPSAADAMRGAAKVPGTKIHPRAKHLRESSANSKIKARILHKVALAAGPSAADAIRGAPTRAATDKAEIRGTQIRPRAGDKRERSATAAEDSPAGGGFFPGDFLRSVPGSPAAPASHGSSGSKSIFPMRYSDGAPIIAGTAAAAQMEAIGTATATELVVANDLQGGGKWFGAAAQPEVRTYGTSAA